MVCVCTLGTRMHHSATIHIRGQSLSILTDISPGEPGPVSFIAADNDGSDGDNWRCKTCNCHHQQTNNQLFTGRMPFLSPNQQWQSIHDQSPNQQTFVSQFARSPTMSVSNTLLKLDMPYLILGMHR